MTITKYETGATSHAVNDLILFADNTRELAEFRDGIYKQTILFNEQNANIYANFTGKAIQKSNYNWLKLQFKQLLSKACTLYNKEMGKTYSYYDMPMKQANEFCRIYADDFNNWKSEHGYK